MKKLFFCLFFLLHCVFLCSASSLMISFYVVNETNDEIILNTESNPEFFKKGNGAIVTFLLDDGKEPLVKQVNVSSFTDRSIPQGEWQSYIYTTHNDRLWVTPPLEIFNTVISSLCVTDASGNILLTEKDITKDSFVLYEKDSFVLYDHRDRIFLIIITDPFVAN